MANKIRVRTTGGMIQGKTEVPREKPIRTPLSLPQIPNRLAWNEILASVVNVQRLLETKTEEKTEGCRKPTPCSTVLPQKLILSQADKKRPHVTKPVCSLPRSQQPANCTYTKAHQSRLRPFPNPPPPPSIFCEGSV